MSDRKRDIGQEILEGVRDIKAHKAGKKTLRVHKQESPPLSPETRTAAQDSQRHGGTEGVRNARGEAAISNQ